MCVNRVCLSPFAADSAAPPLAAPCNPSAHVCVCICVYVWVCKRVGVCTHFTCVRISRVYTFRVCTHFACVRILRVYAFRVCTHFACFACVRILHVYITLAVAFAAPWV